MKEKVIWAIAAFLTLSGFLGSAMASPADPVSYRGAVSDETGKPVNGTYDLQFRYFDHQGRELLLVEQQPQVAIVDGHFQVKLGTGNFLPETPNKTLQQVFTAHAEVLLEVALDGRVHEPRIRVLPAGHSQASRAQLGSSPGADDKPHWKGYYSAGSSAAVQAVKLKPASKAVASSVPWSPVQQDNPFEIEVISLGVSPAVRDLPRVDPEQRQKVEPSEINPPRHETIFDEDGYRFGTRTKKVVDSLAGHSLGEGMATPAPLVDFAGLGNLNGLHPPDTEGTVGPNHYLQVVNCSFAVFDKGGTMLSGPSNTNSLWSGAGGACQNDNSGDGIFLYDEQADRFVLTQFAVYSGNAVCFAVSTTADPTGTYHRYQVNTQRFPDYYKLGVWPDANNNAYFMATNSGSQNQYDVYAIDRENMLVGASARPSKFFQSYKNLMMPADLDGPNLPPPGSPGLFYTFLDGGESYFGNPATDSIDVYEFDIDWNTPANSTFTLVNSIVPPELADFNWTVCGFFGQDCLPQPGTSARLDSASWWPMQRLQYRNFGDYEVLVGAWTVDVTETPDLAAPRWFELRREGGGWSIYQQGTYSPDDSHRWMPSISMDGDGNMAIGYSVVSAPDTIYPSLRYATRAASDPLGTFQTEMTLVDGTGAQTSSASRWGDYAAMEVDPADDCTFWFTSEYIITTGYASWETRIAAFKLPGCGSLTVDPTAQEVCSTSGSATFDVTLLSRFTGTTNLSHSGCPFVASCSLTPSQLVFPATTSVFEISGLGGVSPGLYTLEITATDAADPANSGSREVELTVSTGDPTVPGLTSPSDGATNVAIRPTFVWAAATGATRYDLQVASDAGFSNLVVDATGILGTEFTPSSDLASNTEFFWRVGAANACGESAWSAVFGFASAAAPGDCSMGSVAQEHLNEGFETGVGSWTHSGSGDSWTLSGARTHSGMSAFYADAPSTATDQYLFTPPIVLAAGAGTAALKFWNHQTMESNGSDACWDGGLVEITDDGGATWDQLSPFPETDPYDGPLETYSGNPAGGLDAWCGDPQDWLQTVVSLDAYVGQTVQIRFRLATDQAVSREGWYIDDVIVQSCVASQGEIFADGFESADTSTWSSTTGS